MGLSGLWLSHPPGIVSEDDLAVRPSAIGPLSHTSFLLMLHTIKNRFFKIFDVVLI